MDQLDRVMAGWLLLLMVSAARTGVGEAVKCYESRCDPSEDQYCRLDDGLSHLAECHYANFLESLRHLQEYSDSRHVDGADEEFQGAVVTADRMSCAKVVGVATHPSGTTQAEYRACVPRDGERCRQLIQLTTDRMKDHVMGQHVRVHVNCSRCYNDACNHSATPQTPLLLLPAVLLLLPAVHSLASCLPT